MVTNKKNIDSQTLKIREKKFKEFFNNNFSYGKYNLPLIEKIKILSNFAEEFFGDLLWNMEFYQTKDKNGNWHYGDYIHFQFIYKNNLGFFPLGKDKGLTIEDVNKNGFLIISQSYNKNK
jgi:hypothetical protein